MLPKRREGSVPHPNNNNDVVDATAEKEGEQQRKAQQLRRPACGKFIYVTRNLPDACVSFYHHLSNQMEGTYTQGFANFANDWMGGNIPYGSPLDHLLSFAMGFGDNCYTESDRDDAATNAEGNTIQQKQQQKHERPLLLISYERLKSNLRNEILRIMKFLNLASIPMEVLDNEILPTFEFQYMQQHSNKFQPKSVNWLNDYQFLRRGEIGDGKKMFMETPEETGDGQEEEPHSFIPLFVKFRMWVNREEYCQRIWNLMYEGLDRETADIFHSLVWLDLNENVDELRKSLPANIPRRASPGE
jgi:hypothetical protein